MADDAVSVKNGGGKEEKPLLPLKDKRKLYLDSEANIKKSQIIEELKDRVNSAYRAKRPK